MQQKGFTIIELMVGLVISMLCLMMMLMLFKQISKIGVNAAQDAEYNAQIQTGLLVAQKFVQNAGYGSGYSHDIKLGEYQQQAAVFWRLIPNIGSVPIRYQCQGIAEKITDEGAVQLHRLMLIKKPCNSTDSWQEGIWEDDQVIISIRSTQADPIFSYALNANQCTPYGVDQNAIKGLRQLTIEARREHMDKTINSAICLNNIMESE